MRPCIFTAIVLACTARLAVADVLVEVDQTATDTWLAVSGDAGVSAVLADLANVSASDSTDNKWTPRLDYLIDGYDSMHSRGAPDLPPEMSITTSGLLDGQDYDVFARYLVYTAGDNFATKFGLTSGSLTVFNRNTVGATVVASAPLYGGKAEIRESLLGTVTVIGSAITVYFDDDGAHEGQANAVRFAARPVPEPGTPALLMIGVGAAFIFARNRYRPRSGPHVYRSP
ncbi:MAG: PEP-CTERM sorting domain-containing protein [Planctomycetota bacterium]|nr:PEP-CTERM sorting domain-containing protein [Planctomycetota bacterium]